MINTEKNVLSRQFFLTFVQFQLFCENRAISQLLVESVRYLTNEFCSKKTTQGISKGKASVISVW